MSAANGYCLSVAAVPCGHLGVCYTGLDQTGTAGTILSIVAEPCSSASQMQTWHTQLWQHVVPPEFVFLNASAAVVPVPEPEIAAKVASSQPQVHILLTPATCSHYVHADARVLLHACSHAVSPDRPGMPASQPASQPSCAPVLQRHQVHVLVRS